MDEYEKAVGRAVEAVRSADETRILAAFDGFGSLVAEDVIAELCLWVQDATKRRDVNALIAKARLPLPDRAEDFVAAVKRSDLRALHALAGGELPRLIAALVMLIAAFPTPQEPEASEL